MSNTTGTAIPATRLISFSLESSSQAVFSGHARVVKPLCRECLGWRANVISIFEIWIFEIPHLPSSPLSINPLIPVPTLDPVNSTDEIRGTPALKGSGRSLWHNWAMSGWEGEGGTAILPHCLCRRCPFEPVKHSPATAPIHSGIPSPAGERSPFP